MLTFIGTLHAGLTPHDQLVETLKELSSDILLIEIFQEDLLSGKIDSYPDEMVATYQRASQQGVPVFGFDSKKPEKGIDKELNQKVIKEQKKLLKQHNYTRKDANKPEVLQLLKAPSKQQLVDSKIEQQREEVMTRNIKQHLEKKKHVVVVTGAGHLEYFEQQFPKAIYPLRR